KTGIAEPSRETVRAVDQEVAGDSAQAQAYGDGTTPNIPANSGQGFFARYQILIAGLLMLGTALSIIAALWTRRRRDKRDETKATAAALRGELMAARGICIGRIRSIATEEEDRAANWPRIRATLYGAYVGRLGLLGAELARQVASIYGQASDYASLYNPSNTAGSAASAGTPKKQALETLVRHIDEVLPKLAAIELTGSLALAAGAARPGATAETHAPVSSSMHALWETVRGRIQNRSKNATPPPAPQAMDPGAADYTTIIEQDMARYASYSENVETLDISPDKTPKSRTGS
ncbi:MAG: hypothetical protein KGI97_03035, partial [Alphaproteobacteria bacterium]|nr:hypothetical protein [Alphaproteobacteria bacterium]